MDICIGGILNGKVRKNNENYFSIGNPHSDDVTEYHKQYFHLDGKLGRVKLEVRHKPPN
ncbi:hypothetical protein ACFH22_12315 [Acinetobacter baumannii]